MLCVATTKFIHVIHISLRILLLHRQVLRSLSYVNLIQNNSVTDGIRSITIVASDTNGDNSTRIRADIIVGDRNDGPEIDVGGGDSMDVIMNFVENGPSIPIGKDTHSVQ